MNVEDSCLFRAEELPELGGTSAGEDTESITTICADYRGLWVTQQDSQRGEFHWEIRPMNESVAPKIRLARLSDAYELNELTKRSVLHWGYPPSFLDWEPEAITVDVPFLQRSRTWVLEREDDLLGYVALTASDGQTYLDKLFIDPQFIRHGFGRTLWNHAIDHARRSGVDRLTLYSDPNAAPFYSAMGATFIEEIPTSWSGWRLHAFVVDVQGAPSPDQEERSGFTAGCCIGTPPADGTCG